MPSIGGEDRDRMADAMEELCEKLEEHLTVVSQPPVVNVAAPTINVEAKAPPPIVNVAAPASRKPDAWVFTVSRGSDGLIQTITVTPNGTH